MQLPTKLMLGLVLAFSSSAFSASSDDGCSMPLIATQPVPPDSTAKPVVHFFPQIHHVPEISILSTGCFFCHLNCLTMVPNTHLRGLREYVKENETLQRTFLGGITTAQANLIRELLKWKKEHDGEEVAFFFEGSTFSPPLWSLILTVQRCCLFIQDRDLLDLIDNMPLDGVEDSYIAPEFILRLYQFVPCLIANSYESNHRRVISFFDAPPETSFRVERQETEVKMLIREENTCRAIEEYLQRNPHIKHVALIFGAEHTFGYEQPGDMFSDANFTLRERSLSASDQIWEQIEDSLITAGLVKDRNDPLAYLRVRQYAIAERTSPKEPRYPDFVLTGKEALDDHGCCQPYPVFYAELFRYCWKLAGERPRLSKLAKLL